MIVKLREQRESVGVKLIERVCELTGKEQSEMAVFASMATASITYLIMLGEFCPVYNGIPLDKESGWEEIEKGKTAWWIICFQLIKFFEIGINNIITIL